MKEIKRTVFAILAMGLFFSSCKKEEDPMMDPNPEATTQSFTVTIENNQMAHDYFESGVFNTPLGASEPGGAGPGNAYEFTIHAGPGSKLSFATMFVGSNDLFFAPDGNGIDLFDGNSPVIGDVTSQIKLWDAGTEDNQEPGMGSDQPMNQSGANTGAAENGTVREISNIMDGFSYPSVANTIQVTLSAGATVNEIVVKIENLAGSTTPIAPGVWVIHSNPNPLFTENNADMGHGLEALAEDGNPASLAMYNGSKTGLNTPFAPGVWALHSSGNPIFTVGSSASAGLEKLAEDGDPSIITMDLSSNSLVSQTAVFNTPQDASSPGPIFPGDKYTFTFTANEGDYLSFGTMFIQSNDLFYGTPDGGINLWNGNSPISGEITNQLVLWDAGTEVNEFPGVGLNQAPRQSGANTGVNENGNVMEVNDGYSYLPTMDNIQVTITKN